MNSKAMILLYIKFGLLYLILWGKCVQCTIQFQHDTEQCLDQLVEYQCTVTGTGFLSLTWRILEDDGTLFGNTVPYTSSGNGASNTIGGVFAVEQLEGSPLVSNISFTVQSSINGYTIVCEDSTNTMNNESFTINVSDPPSPPVNITVSFSETTADITWTPSSISSSQCITSYTVNTTTNNTNINTTDTSISIPLTGLSAGMYCISIASIDTANRIGTHSEQECFGLTVPPAPIMTYDSSSSDGSILVSVTFNESSIPLVTTAYISLVSNNNSQKNYTDSMKPFEFEGLTIQRGINYTVTGFGENIVGNGSSTSITVIYMSVTPSVIISSSVTVSPTSNNAGISSSVIAAIAVSIIFVLIVGSAVTVVISVILGVHFYKKRSAREKRSSNADSKVRKLKSDDVIKLQSKSNSKYLQILDTTYAVCNGDDKTACSFTVIKQSDDRNIRLQIEDGRQLAIIKQYYLQCGSDRDGCDLIVSGITDDGQFAIFKSATQPGAHIEVLPNGHITSTTETAESSDASLFKVRRIDLNNVFIQLNEDTLRTWPVVDTVQLMSKLTNKYLRILENGDIDCLGDGGANSKFIVLKGVANPDSIRLQNTEYKDKYLSFILRYHVGGYGKGSSDCELVPCYTDKGTFVSFKSATHDVGYIRVGQDGQITVPTETSDESIHDDSQFRLGYESDKSTKM